MIDNAGGTGTCVIIEIRDQHQSAEFSGPTKGDGNFLILFVEKITKE